MSNNDQSSWSRRQFLGGLSALLAASGALLPRRWAAAHQGNVTEEEAKEIYRKGISIDCLASPNTVNIFWPPPGPLTQIQLDNVKASGLTAVNLTVGGSKRTFEKTVRKIAFWTGQLDEHASHLTLIRHHRDFDRAKREGRLGLVFGFQDTTSLGEDLTRLAPRCGGTDDRPLRDGVRAGWDPIHDADQIARRSLLLRTCILPGGSDSAPGIRPLALHYGRHRTD